MGDCHGPCQGGRGARQEVRPAVVFSLVLVLCDAQTSLFISLALILLQCQLVPRTVVSSCCSWACYLPTAWVSDMLRPSPNIKTRFLTRFPPPPPSSLMQRLWLHAAVEHAAMHTQVLSVSSLVLCVLLQFVHVNCTARTRSHLLNYLLGVSIQTTALHLQLP